VTGYERALTFSILGRQYRIFKPPENRSGRGQATAGQQRKRQTDATLRDREGRD